MDAGQRQRTVPVGYRLLNPLGVPLTVISATSKVVRVSMPAGYWLDVTLPDKAAEIKLTNRSEAA